MAISYKTSSTIINGRPVDMLHDFYIPAISLAERYDRVAGYLFLPLSSFSRFFRFCWQGRENAFNCRG